MMPALIAGAGLLLALLLAGVAALRVGRARRAAAARLDRALGRLGERVDELSVDLGEAIEQVRAEARRARAIDGIVRSRDVEEVVARTVEAVSGLAGARGAALKVSGAGGGTIVASAGLGRASVEALPSSELLSPGLAGLGPVGEVPLRAVALSYHYGAAPGPDAGALRSAMAVPLAAGNEQLGFLAVYCGGEQALDAETFDTLEAIAAHAGSAILAAQHGEVGLQGPVVTELLQPSRRALQDTLAREIARAQRRDDPLTLLLVDVDELGPLARRHGAAAGESALAEVEQALAEAAREKDVLCRTGVDAFGLVLVGGTRIEAEARFARAQATLRRAPARVTHPLTLSGGIAELRPTDDAVSLLDSAGAALRRAKASGRGTAA